MTLLHSGGVPAPRERGAVGPGRDVSPPRPPETGPGSTTSTALVRPEPPKRAKRGAATTLALRSLGPVVLAALWAAGTTSGWIRPDVLASPAQVAAAFGELYGDGQLQDALAVSLTRAGLGLALGATAGLLLGLVSGLLALGEDLIDPAVQMLRTIPFLSLVPLFIVWFGIGEASKVILIAVATSFPMYVNALSGTRGADRKQVEAARVFGVTGVRLVREVILPGALPSLLVGLRLSLTLSVIALIAAEEINSTAGLGYLMTQAREFVRTDILVVVILLYAVLGLLADLAVRVLERLLMPWRAGVAVR
ncbi:sulfonate transport system permease protein [Sinosporangium album]|uniref:Sulfonate transport system permease protein n=1 Tax=Sinosporangium album TaxID=504805 RepID=A0A1G7T4X9_9ACTN|nr:ABC transporter permease [Sinosporangium album]SDG30427.1 sulfonate transport system permease protein [Sinosporangium album]